VTPKALVFLYEWKREKISIEMKSSFFVFVFFVGFLFNENKGRKREQRREGKVDWFRSTSI
jgi:hypothetical protein